jgi:uncharacterized protein
MFEKKLALLKKEISRHESLLVAFSGGVDSGLLLKVAFNLLGTKAAGCTALSPSLPQAERLSAEKSAREIGAPYFIIEYDELAIPGYSSNSKDRCYLCKSTLFRHLKKVASEHGFQAIAYGANHDDLNEFRPGMRAADEMTVFAPLLQCRITKEEIRQMSRQLGLSIWNKPASACLSSRIPIGMEITHQKLAQVESAELWLRQRGFLQIRVRHHGEFARIEIAKEEMPLLLKNDLVDEIIIQLKSIGFKWVTIDPEGYRPGGANSSTPPTILAGESL